MLDEKILKFSASELEQFYREYLNEKLSRRSFRQDHASRRMLVSLLLERHRESYSGLDAGAYGIAVLLGASGLST